MDRALERDIRLLWDYMRLDMPVPPGDCIVGFGCYDEDIPRRAAELYRQGLAPVVVFSGGLGRNTRHIWNAPEADRFAAIAREAGVPESAILVEDRSANSAENLLFTKRLLDCRDVPARRIIAVHKPYMERRLAAAMGVYWPEAEAAVTSPQVTLEEHLAHGERSGMTRRKILETLVGDVQRIRVYARKGYQLPQPMPDAVWGAYTRMVRRGYTGQLVKEL